MLTTSSVIMYDRTWPAIVLVLLAFGSVTAIFLSVIFYRALCLCGTLPSCTLSLMKQLSISLLLFSLTQVIILVYQMIALSLPMQSAAQIAPAYCAALLAPQILTGTAILMFLSVIAVDRLIVTIRKRFENPEQNVTRQTVRNTVISWSVALLLTVAHITSLIRRHPSESRGHCTLSFALFKDAQIVLGEAQNESMYSFQQLQRGLQNESTIYSDANRIDKNRSLRINDDEIRRSIGNILTAALPQSLWQMLTIILFVIVFIISRRQFLKFGLNTARHSLNERYGIWANQQTATCLLPSATFFTFSSAVMLALRVSLYTGSIPVAFRLTLALLPHLAWISFPVAHPLLCCMMHKKLRNNFRTVLGIANVVSLEAPPSASQPKLDETQVMMNIWHKYYNRSNSDIVQYRSYAPTAFDVKPPCVLDLSSQQLADVEEPQRANQARFKRNFINHQRKSRQELYEMKTVSAEIPNTTKNDDHT